MFAVTLALALALAGRAEFPKPAPSTDDEPRARQLSPAAAAAYLDAAAVNWTRDRKCVTCHTNMPYLAARALLPGGGGAKEVRAFLEREADGWAGGAKPRSTAAVVATAFALAADDRRAGKLHPATRAALDRMWDVQLKTGEWKWLKCDWPPLEHDDYYGAVLAALAAGYAPGDYAKTERAKAGLEKLRAYLAKTPPPDLHHTAMLLWASRHVDGLMTADGQKKAVAALKARQRKDGGWNLPGLGAYERHDGTVNDRDAASDGYGTGFVTFVLLEAGEKPADPAVAGGVRWLKANQRESGRWFTRSLSTDRAHYITTAGTAFAVLALHAAGEKLGE
ncbi:MAG: squalene--hopene cyclase [Isosphaera sp.]|nr:squalene--hopene cyclase [Isosphaera sp.]